MSPVTNRSEAKEGGFAQVREALVAFQGNVVAQDARGNKTEFAQWGSQLDDNGKPKAPKEYLQIVCTNVTPVEVTEELTMDISEGWTFRENCSDFKGSFWIEAFLLSADKAKLLIPDGLIGKRIQFKKFTLEAVNSKTGERQPKFDATNFIIEKVIGLADENPVAQTAAVVTPKAETAPVVTASPVVATPQVVAPVVANASAPDHMTIALELAVGKTEAQFRSAVALHKDFIGSPMLALAKAGVVTQSLVNEGKLALVDQGNKKVYQKVG